MDDKLTLQNDAEIALWSRVYAGVMVRAKLLEEAQFRACRRADTAVYDMRERMSIDDE